MTSSTNLIAYALGVTQAVNSSYLYVGLTTTVTNGDGPGQEVTTTQYPGYARSPVRREKSFASPGTSKWTHALGANIGLFTNAEAINFPIVGSGGTGGTIVGWGIYDAATGGNELFYGGLVASGSSLKVGYHTGKDDAGVANDNFIFSAAHGLSDGDTIRTYQVYDGRLGDGSLAGAIGSGGLTTVSNVSTDSFEVSTAILDSGAMLFAKAGSITLAAGKIPAIPAGGLGIRFA